MTPKRPTPPILSADGRDLLAEQCGMVRVISRNRPLPDGVRCHYCGEPATTRDHIVPDSRGGVSEWWNLVASCAPCNTEKASRLTCDCPFCVRATALWLLGYKRDGLSRGQKRLQYEHNRVLRETMPETTNLTKQQAALWGHLLA